MNILIPMAGLGSRVHSSIIPKPLVPIHGEPMISLVVKHLGLNGHYIFVVQRSHYDNHDMRSLLYEIAPGCNIIAIDGITEGAADTALLAKHLINNDRPLIISDCDHIAYYDVDDFLAHIACNDGCLLVHKNNHPKCSYCKLGSYGYVTEVREKEVISNLANVGMYGFKRGSDFVHYALEMIRNNITYNNEHYIAPIYNLLIQDNKKITTLEANKVHLLGSKEWLDIYLSEEHND
ncbi:glycosyltransferase family 2 protein [Patescibacteria group bacterium]|nr:glycosyltransferase family 2 protein [Patescibacteria group bacterium]